MDVGEVFEGWVLSFKFDSSADHGRAYEAARDIVFGHNVDASVYRVFLNGVPHVVIIGNSDFAPSIRSALEAALIEGEDTMLPEQVLLQLTLRFLEMRMPGTKIERRGERPMRIWFA